MTRITYILGSVLGFPCLGDVTISCLLSSLAENGHDVSAQFGPSWGCADLESLKVTYFIYAVNLILAYCRYLAAPRAVG